MEVLFSCKCTCGNHISYSDYYFTEMGIWGFNPDYLTGVYLTNLPLEEILFFICIPYACTFTYFSLRYLIQNLPFPNFHRTLSIVLLVLSLALLGIYYDNWYTFTTFLGLALWIGLCLYYKVNLGFLYTAYLAILPFFFISNGILTGSFLESPIVWYNDTQNIGLRMFTIPVEDTFYGLLMILMNITIYEFIKKKFS